MLFLAGSEVILDVERFPDLFRRLALDHVGHSLARDVQESLDVQVVCGQDQLEEGPLVDLEEVCVPGGDVVCALLFVLVVLGRGRIVLVIGGPLDDLNKINTKMTHSVCAVHINVGTSD